MHDLVIALAALISALMPATATPSVEAQVLYVIDGDTIGVSIDGTHERVRYIGVDAPEETHEETQAECFADEATAANEALVSGKRVLLRADSDNRDAYDRLLRYVYVDGVFVNEELVRQGAATALAIPPNTRHHETFMMREAEAHSAARGLWGACR